MGSRALTRLACPELVGRDAEIATITERISAVAGRLGIPFPAETIDTPVAGLTRREREVAGLVAQGLTNREIADRLVLSVRTAESHVDQIRSKLGFRTRAQIAAWVGQRAVEM